MIPLQINVIGYEDLRVRPVYIEFETIHPVIYHSWPKGKIGLEGS